MMHDCDVLSGIIGIMNMEHITGFSFVSDKVNIIMSPDAYSFEE